MKSAIRRLNNQVQYCCVIRAVVKNEETVNCFKDLF